MSAFTFMFILQMQYSGAQVPRLSFMTQTAHFHIFGEAFLHFVCKCVQSELPQAGTSIACNNGECNHDLERIHQLSFTFHIEFPNQRGILG